MYASTKVDQAAHVVRNFVAGAHDNLVQACAAGAAVPRPPPAPNEHCTAELAAAARERQQGNYNKLFLFKALLGGVCRHGVPLRGCFAFTPRGGAWRRF